MDNNAPQLLLTPAVSKIEIDSVNKGLQQYLIFIENELRSLSKGSLYICYKNSRPYFIEYLNGHTRGITKSPDVIYQLARRSFLLLQAELIKQIMDMGWTPKTADIISTACNEIDALLLNYKEAGLDIDRIVMTPNQQIWNSERGSQKPTRREELKYPTRGRIYMRSKSEKDIGNLLEKLHIPYRYEPRIRINNIDYHPDFIIMLPNDKLVILEHVGRMDLADYNKGFIARLQAFDSVNLLIGRNVFLTFEYDTRDEDLIMPIITQILLSDPADSLPLIYAAQNAGCKINIPAKHLSR